MLARKISVYANVTPASSKNFQVQKKTKKHHMIGDENAAKG